jgi:predicted DNA-binding protein with PD1-like motif
MRAAEVVEGRRFGLVLEDGEDLLSSLTQFCADQHVRQGYLSMFLAGLRDVEVVGSCSRLEDPEAPVWDSVFLENAEAIGCGTIATDPSAPASVSLHVHVSVGLKAHSAMAHTSHLIRAQVRFLAEMHLVEVTSPIMTRVREQDLYDVPLLHFG